MNLPFTYNQFLNVFKNYNESIWPVLLLFPIAALLALVATVRTRHASGYMTLAVLTGMWLVNGVGYHIMFFSIVNPLAKVFGFMFVLQALLFASMMFSKDRVFDATWNRWSIVGLILSLYAVIVYPILGVVNGHSYPQMPIIGTAPCPTVIFTLGLMLMAKDALPRWLFIIPLLWTVIGGSAAFVLGMREDLGLIVSLVVCFVYVTTARHTKTATSALQRIGRPISS